MHTDKPRPAPHSGRPLSSLPREGLREEGSGRKRGNLREERVDEDVELGPTVPCTNCPQGENGKSYPAASPSGRGARTCCLSVGHHLSLEISAEGSSCPGAGQRWAVEPETPPFARSAEPPPTGLPPVLRPCRIKLPWPLRGPKSGWSSLQGQGAGAAIRHPGWV